MDFGMLQMLMLLLSSQQNKEEEKTISCKVAEFQTQPNFDINSFVGHWYVVMRSTDDHSKYYPALDNLKVVYYISNDQTLRAFPTGRIRSPRMDMCQPNRAKVIPGRYTKSKMHFKLETLAKVFGGHEFLERAKIEYDYWILSTDYTNYAVIYTCWVVDQKGECIDSDVMVISRSVKGVSQTSINAIKEALVLVCLNIDDLIRVRHDGACPFVQVPKF